MKSQITKQQVFDLAMESFGVVPGFIKESAERSLHVAYLYTAGNAVMENASFNKAEMNAIELRVSSLNHCESCVKGHSFLLKQQGVSEQDIKAILDQEDTSSERFNILLKATDHLYHVANNGYPDHVLDFLHEHLTETELSDIIGLISLKVISNYTNIYLAAVKKAKLQVAG